MTRLEAVELLREGYKKLRHFDYEQFDIAVKALMQCEKIKEPETRPLYMYLGADA